MDSSNSPNYDELLESDDISELLLDLDICKSEYFSDDEQIKLMKFLEEHPLPNRIKADSGGKYYKIKNPKVKAHVLPMYLSLLQAKRLENIEKQKLKDIKDFLKDMHKMITFFYHLTIVWLILIGISLIILAFNWLALTSLL